MTSRFRDDGTDVYSFMDEILLVCPRCAACAISRQLRHHGLPATATARQKAASVEPPGWFAPRRLTCSSCGYVKEWATSTIHRGWREGRDDYFELPLWLTTPCCGELLWAYNKAHLDYIQSLVGADLRERRPGPRGWSNASLAGRLPRWMKAAKNREQVLACLQDLQTRASAAQQGAAPDAASRRG